MNLLSITKIMDQWVIIIDKWSLIFNALQEFQIAQDVVAHKPEALDVTRKNDQDNNTKDKDDCKTSDGWEQLVQFGVSR